MCVIFHLKPGYTLPKSLLANACHNNPHGYGIIIKKDGKINVVKDLPADGNDPEVIYKILKDNEDADRYCHVRWKTQGAISMDNTQPFQVYDDRGREIWFAHNGTLSNYSPSYNHGRPNDPNEVSDSRKFAQDVLMKYLPKFIGDNGIGDYNDPVMKEIIEKAWSYSNKGIVIANDLEPLILGTQYWEYIKTKETIDDKVIEGEFYASNDDYFKELKRGPLHDKLEAEKKKEAEEKRASLSAFNNSSKEIVPLSSPAFSASYSLGEIAAEILEDFDLYSAEGYIQLANLTYAEWITLIKKMENDDLASMFLYLTDFLKKDYESLETALTDNKNLQSELELLRSVTGKKKAA